VLAGEERLQQAAAAARQHRRVVSGVVSARKVERSIITRCRLCWTSVVERVERRYIKGEIKEEGMASETMHNADRVNGSRGATVSAKAKALVCEDGDALMQTKVAAAVAVIHQALDEYGASHLALSFNGGKDSTVLLALLNIALRERGGNMKGVTAFFFEDEHDFDEVREFTLSAAKVYGLDLLVFRGIDFKQGMEILTASGERSGDAVGANPRPKSAVTAVVMGTRSTDPNAFGQRELSPSSAGWPEFMRVNPIIDWEYADVWRFLLSTGTSYCSLYDQGYTSLGNKLNTVKNEQLRVAADRDDDERYLPAYELKDGTQERCGRVSSYKTKSS